MNGALEYRASDLPDPAVIADLYAAAGLRLPDFHPARVGRAVQGSNITLACFERLDDGEERLVGFLRGWTDFEYDGYLCDLAVHPELRHRGIGKELLRRATTLGAPEVRWVLLASPEAKDYYAGLGWQALDVAWKWPPDSA